MGSITTETLICVWIDELKYDMAGNFLNPTT